jgi:hypothetical protein
MFDTCPSCASTRIVSFGGGNLLCLGCRKDFACPTVLVSPKPRKPAPVEQPKIPVEKVVGFLFE